MTHENPLLSEKEPELIIYPASEVTIVYEDENGEQYTQPLTDIVESGTLTDPSTGEDLEIVGWIREVIPGK